MSLAEGIINLGYACNNLIPAIIADKEANGIKHIPKIAGHGHQRDTSGSFALTVTLKNQTHFFPERFGTEQVILSANTTNGPPIISKQDRCEATRFKLVYIKLQRQHRIRKGMRPWATSPMAHNSSDEG
jgi:hypothetical protein